MKVKKLLKTCSAVLFPDPIPAKVMPLPGKVLLIVGQDKKTIDEYIRATGLVPDGFMGYTSIQNMEGVNKPSPGSVMEIWESSR